jgi:hypothetical protein
MIIDAFTKYDSHGNIPFKLQRHRQYSSATCVDIRQALSHVILKRKGSGGLDQPLTL